MGANVPQTLEQVQAMLRRLEARGQLPRSVRGDGIRAGDLVQVKRAGRVVCGLVESRCGPVAPELLAVRTICGRWLVGSAFVHVCPGVPGRACACAASPDGRSLLRTAGEAAPVFPAPLGNTGVTA